jgi:acyl-CoA dehydrogenase
LAVIAIPYELTALTGTLRHYIEREIRPIEDSRAQELQETGTLHDLMAVKRDLRRRSAEHGFYQLFMPEAVGGGGVGYLGLALCHEAVASAGSFLAENSGLLPASRDRRRSCWTATTTSAGATSSRQ